MSTHCGMYYTCFGSTRSYRLNDMFYTFQKHGGSVATGYSRVQYILGMSLYVLWCFSFPIEFFVLQLIRIKHPVRICSSNMWGRQGKLF